MDAKLAAIKTTELLTEWIKMTPEEREQVLLAENKELREIVENLDYGSETAIQIITMLKEMGYGKPGDANTIWAMVRDSLADLKLAHTVLRPFAHYSAMCKAHPMGNMGNTIHQIHSPGSKYHAELTVSQCDAAANVLHEPKKEE